MVALRQTLLLSQSRTNRLHYFQDQSTFWVAGEAPSNGTTKLSDPQGSLRKFRFVFSSVFDEVYQQTHCQESVIKEFLHRGSTTLRFHLEVRLLDLTKYSN
jgi:hypothetical protein